MLDAQVKHLSIAQHAPNDENATSSSSAKRGADIRPNFRMRAWARETKRPGAGLGAPEPSLRMRALASAESSYPDKTAKPCDVPAPPIWRSLVDVLRPGL
jgi:hypothetical protein